MITLTLKQIAVPYPFSAWLIETATYPLPSNVASAAKAFAAALLQRGANPQLGHLLLLQHEYLSLGKDAFRSRSSEWRPEAGLGVWPDRPAPRLWVPEDFFRMARGEHVPLMHRLLRLAGEAESSSAFEALFGTGMILAIAPGIALDALYTAYRHTLFPRLTEPAFQGFPFYIPLLDVASVSNRSALDLAEWLGDSRIYLRESPQDKGILFVTDLEPDALLYGSGAKKDETDHWRFER